MAIFKNITLINLTLPYSSELEVLLLDNMGSFIGLVHDGEVSAGTKQIIYQNSSLASGQYYMVFKWDGGILAKKVIVAK
ncbi:MAG: hypothetical protein ACLFR2_05405 [Candidatus Kapaibacterium sp.]